MSYTTDDDLLTVMPERTLIQLSADDPAAGVPDWDRIIEARSYADGQIDARLRQRYSLPLDTVPRELRDWALALARRWLYERRPDQDIPAPVVDAAKEALDALEAIRDGKMGLEIVDDSPVVEVHGAVVVSAPDRVFTRSILDLY